MGISFADLFLSHHPLSKETTFFIKVFLNPFGRLRHTCSTQEQSKCFLLQQTQIDKLQSEKALLKNRLSTKYIR